MGRRQRHLQCEWQLQRTGIQWWILEFGDGPEPGSDQELEFSVDDVMVIIAGPPSRWGSPRGGSREE